MKYRQPHKNSGLAPRVACALLMVLALSAALWANAAVAAERNVVKPMVTDSDLVIPIAEVTANATFYPVLIGGTRMEVLAVKAPDGTIRTAFNTCQVCYASGNAFYKQEKTVLVCQNCGNSYRMGQVETRAGGCNPVPIFPQNKKVTETSIIISKEFLEQSKNLFASWKRD